MHMRIIPQLVVHPSNNMRINTPAGKGLLKQYEDNTPASSGPLKQYED